MIYRPVFSSLDKIYKQYYNNLSFDKLLSIPAWPFCLS